MSWLMYWVGKERGKEEERNRQNSGGGNAGAGIILLPPFVVLAVALFWWVYPITGLIALVVWHVAVYTFSQIAVLTFTSVEWCDNPSFFSLLPTLRELHRPGASCVDSGLHHLFGFSWVALLFATLAMFVTSFFVVRRLERRLARSSVYVAARHAWRCAFPGALFLFWLQTADHPPGITAAGQIGISLLLGVAAHFTFRYGPRITAAPPDRRKTGVSAAQRWSYPFGVIAAVVVVLLYGSAFAVHRIADPGSANGAAAENPADINRQENLQFKQKLAQFQAQGDAALVSDPCGVGAFLQTGSGTVVPNAVLDSPKSLSGYYLANTPREKSRLHWLEYSSGDGLCKVSWHGTLLVIPTDRNTLTNLRRMGVTVPPQLNVSIEDLEKLKRQ